MNGDTLLTGMIAPAVTPFDKDGEVDVAAFNSDVSYLLDCGVDGIGVGGSTGEGASLCDEELSILIRNACETASGRCPVVAGIIRSSTRAAVSAATSAQAAGADALLVTPVVYGSATDRENIEFFDEIGAATGLPVIIYNVVPSNDITPRVFSRMARDPKIIGIKEVHVERIPEMVTACGAHAQVYNACDSFMLNSYLCGATGAISALITVAPDLVVEQWQAFRSDDLEKAARIDRELRLITALYAGTPFVGKLKKLITLQGRPVGYPRRPVHLPVDTESQTMICGLQNLGRLATASDNRE